MCVFRLLSLALALSQFSVLAATAPRGKWEQNSPEWYQSAEGKRIGETILSWQAESGAWPKNLDTTAQPFSGDRKTIKGTFDNSATTGELRFLSRAFEATKDERYREAFLKGLRHILQAQYPTGGWPQFFPPSTQYHRHITFNDDAMVRLMDFLREIDRGTVGKFVDDSLRVQARDSFQAGIECILKCQVIVKGQRTVWCAQHDEIDYSPRPGRTFELVSLSGAESARILGLLMSLDHPSREMIRAVEGGAAWFNASKLSGIRQTNIGGDKRIIQDPGASPLWARFYEIESNLPIFSGRDAVKKYDVAEIESERRNGYAWYGTWGERVAKDYKKWVEKYPGAGALAKEPVRIAVIGDSTVCDYPANEPTRGWGQFIAEHWHGNARVINMARSGRSSKTFIAEGLWDKTLKQEPDYVLIQFGHNDSHGAGKPESTEASSDYRGFLRRYVDEARAIGATPILISPMHRRTFGTDGKLSDILAPYAEAMKMVALEKKAAFIDLHASSGRLFEKMGEQAADKFSNKPGDRTHFNEEGAKAMAALVLEGLARVEPRLR